MLIDRPDPVVFIEAFRMVLESFSSMKVVGADVGQAEEGEAAGDIFVSMGLMGDVDAQVRMSMNEGTVRSLASDMLPGFPVTELDELAMSAVGELCNMMMGTACQNLAGQYEKVDITPPVVALEPIGPEGEAGDEASFSIRLTEKGPVCLIVTPRYA